MRGLIVWTEFEYSYRDAGNFKAFGSVWLEGVLDAGQQAALKAALEGGEFFIAEQLKIPTLYEGLCRWSSGAPTRDDHCWHAFVRMREHANVPPEATISSSAHDFAERFARIDRWQEELSPHFSQQI